MSKAFWIAVAMGGLSLGWTAEGEASRHSSGLHVDLAWTTCRKDEDCAAVPGPCTWTGVNRGSAYDAKAYFSALRARVQCSSTVFVNPPEAACRHQKCVALEPALTPPTTAEAEVPAESSGTRRQEPESSEPESSEGGTE